MRNCGARVNVKKSNTDTARRRIEKSQHFLISNSPMATNNTPSPPEISPSDDRTSPGKVQQQQATPETLPRSPEGEREDADTSESSNLKTTLKKRWWLLPLLGIILVIGGIAVLRLRENVTQEAALTETAPVSVRTTTAELESLRAWISSEGTAQAVDFKHLAFEVEGDVTYLARRNGRRLREGDRVEEGELLARVDDRELQADVRQAQAALAEARQQRATAAADVAQAEAQVAQQRSQVEQAQAQLEKARSNLNLARSELERYRLLYNEGVVSASDFDTRRNRVEDAEADVRAAQTQVTAARDGVRAARTRVTAAREQLEATQSQIETARARLTQAEVALEGASLYAPFDGVVAYLNISEGEYYNPQIVTTQLAGDYQGILDRIPIVVIDPSQFEVVVDLAAPSGDRVRPDQQALVASESRVEAIARNDDMALLDSARARGEVFSVNPAISPGGRAIQATVRINEGEQSLQHGERVLTWIAVEEKQDTVVVPLNAVVFRNQQPYIFVVNPDEGVVEQRPVELGITGIRQREILGGVEPGELVVEQGQNRLVDGTPVEILGDSAAQSMDNQNQQR